MRFLLLVVALSQPVTPVKIVNPENQSQGLGNANPLKVNCVSGCSGSAGSGNDGGYTVVIQGPSLLDGGIWTVTPPIGAINNAGACISVSTTTAVLSSNALRRSASICARITNTDTTFMKLGLTATTSNFPLEPGQCYNLTAPGSIYTGEVDAVANSGTQNICVVETN